MMTFEEKPDEKLRMRILGHVVKEAIKFSELYDN